MHDLGRAVREQIHDAGYSIVQEEEEISDGVLRALNLSSHDRRTLIDEKATKRLRSVLNEFSAAEGSPASNFFESGE